MCLLLFQGLLPGVCVPGVFWFADFKSAAKQLRYEKNVINIWQFRVYEMNCKNIHINQTADWNKWMHAGPSLSSKLDVDWLVWLNFHFAFSWRIVLFVYFGSLFGYVFFFCFCSTFGCHHEGLILLQKLPEHLTWHLSMFDEHFWPTKIACDRELLLMFWFKWSLESRFIEDVNTCSTNGNLVRMFDYRLWFCHWLCKSEWVGHCMKCKECETDWWINVTC